MEKKFKKNAKQNKDVLIVFDRDGTLIYDDGYFGKNDNWKKELRFYKGAIETIKELNSFTQVIVASNQIGVALGLYDTERVEEINKYIDKIFKSNGANIDGWYYSPYIEKKWALEQGLDLKSPWVLDNFPKTRKPQIGMIEQAVADFGKKITSYKKIIVIGDSLDDMHMALKVENGIGIFFENVKNTHLLKKIKELRLTNSGKVFIIQQLLLSVKIIKEIIKEESI